METKRVRPKLDIITLTDAAIARVKELVNERAKPTEGIRIKISSKGCSGFSYELEYADSQEPLDEVIMADTVKVFIDPKSIMFLIGTELDYQVTKLQSGFIFTNPNETGRCGCGTSFSV